MQNKAIALLICLFASLYSYLQDTTKIRIGKGPEDFLLDTTDGVNRLIISCDERRDWDNEITGNIWQLDITSNKASIIKRIGDDSLNTFNPHGIYLLKVKENKYLFVVNHFDKPQQSEIRRYLLKDSTLTFEENFSYESKINAICAVSKLHFYFSNDNVFYGKLIEYKNGKLNTIDKRIQYPNGINIKDSTLYLSTTLSGNIYAYPIDKQHTLSKPKKITSIAGGDNIRFYENTLLTTSHPSFRKFLAHRKDSSEISPTEVYQVDLSSGEKKLLFKDDGTIISAASTAILYDNSLFISQVFEGFILRIKYN